MSRLYTKDGRPLKVDGDKVFDASGRQVGRIRGQKIFASDGSYAATIIGDRAVYRSTHSSSMGSSFSPSSRGGTGAVQRAGSGVWGDEPFS